MQEDQIMHRLKVRMGGSTTVSPTPRTWVPFVIWVQLTSEPLFTSFPSCYTEAQLSRGPHAVTKGRVRPRLGVRLGSAECSLPAQTSLIYSTKPLSLPSCKWPNKPPKKQLFMEVLWALVFSRSAWKQWPWGPWKGNVVWEIGWAGKASSAPDHLHCNESFKIDI